MIKLGCFYYGFMHLCVNGKMKLYQICSRLVQSVTSLFPAKSCIILKVSVPQQVLHFVIHLILYDPHEHLMHCSLQCIADTKYSVLTSFEFEIQKLQVHDQAGMFLLWIHASMCKWQNETVPNLFQVSIECNQPFSCKVLYYIKGLSALASLTFCNSLDSL